MVPWIGCFESSYVKETFVNNSKGIRHGFPPSLFYPYFEALLRPYLARYCNNRSYPGCRILDHHRDNPPESDRHVVQSLGMRLYHRDEGIYIGSHIRTSPETHLGVSLCCWGAYLLDHRSGIFESDYCP